MATSIDSSDHQLSAESRWINPETRLPNILRFSQSNLETRTVAATELVKEGFYPSVLAAAPIWQVPYKRLLSRVKGKHPVTQNSADLNSSIKSSISSKSSKSMTQFISSKQVHNASNLIYLKY
jgi:hypothetical protein